MNMQGPQMLQRRGRGRGGFKQLETRDNNVRQTCEILIIVRRENWDLITRLLAFYCLSLLLTFAGKAVINCIIGQRTKTTKIVTLQFLLIV